MSLDTCYTETETIDQQTPWPARHAHNGSPQACASGHSFLSPPFIINHLTILVQQFTLNSGEYQVATMSFVRTNTAESAVLVSCDGARTTKWQTPRSGNSVLEIQTYPDSSKITKAQRDQLGILTPCLPVVYATNTNRCSASISLAPQSRRVFHSYSRVSYIPQTHWKPSSDTHDQH